MRQHSIFFCLLFSVAVYAQPVDIARNGRATAPSRYGVSALTFELSPAGLSGGVAELQLQLPNGPMTILRRKAFQSRGTDAGRWQGTANGRQDSEVLLTLQNGYLAGTIQIGPDLYEIRPQGANHIIEKLDTSSFPQCKGQVKPDTQGDLIAGSSNTTSPSTAGDGLVTVDVLTVYTPQARTAAGGAAQIQTVIQSAVDRTNLAFTNSLVNGSFRLVGTAEVAHDDAGNLNSDLSWLTSDPGVASLRNAKGADLVSLIVENGAGYCGMGYVMNPVSTSFAPYAFQVTARSCAVGNLSYAHEHGHNSGMEHDPANGSTAASYSWSYGHLVDGVFRTVMSYASQCPSGCTRVPYFSNPSVIYSGYPTGVANQRDNARTANSTLPIVAQFRPEAATSLPVPPTSLTASAASASQINLTWLDNSSNESGFQIERSTDGVTFSQVASVGVGVKAYSNTGLTGSTAYTYRVRAFNALGSSDPTNNASATTLTPQLPAAPDTLTAGVASSTQINLTWADRSTNETGFRIERSTNGGAYSMIATAGSNVTSYASTGLTANTSYSYRVLATNADGTSGYSNVATATTPNAPPPAPGGFSGTPRFTGSGKTKVLTGVSLAWTDVASNTGYNIERCQQSGKGSQATCVYSALVTLSAADVSSQVDSTATTKGSYQYRIRSFNTAGSSAWTAITVNAN